MLYRAHILNEQLIIENTFYLRTSLVAPRTYTGGAPKGIQKILKSQCLSTFKGIQHILKSQKNSVA
jgi:hypothetical protein